MRIFFKWELILCFIFFEGCLLSAGVESIADEVSVVPKAGMGMVLGTGPLSMAQVDALFSGTIEDLAYKFRDPFKMPEAEIKTVESKTDLERYPLGEFKLVGILTGPKHLRAMLLGPSGKTYFVSEKMKIGTSGGIIHRITSEGLKIREKVVNAIGQVENMDSDIKLASSAKERDAGKGPSPGIQGALGMHGASVVQGASAGMQGTSEMPGSAGGMEPSGMQQGMPGTQGMPGAQ